MGLSITIGAVYSLCALVAMCAGFPAGGNGELQPNFYGATCPQAETIVRQEVIRWLHSDIGFAAGLVRMHFHDCFVRGCDASILLESTPDNTAERDSPVNNPSLRGFEVIDSAKARLEDACPGVVSCADILAFAARDSVALSGGPRYDVPGGRRDGTLSMASEVADNIPAPTFNLDQLTQSFAAKGLTQEEMVTLSGAHTIGRAHCTAFSDRLYNFSATGVADPTLDPPFLAQLQHACPAAGDGGVDPGLVVPMEPRTPHALDTLYYWGVLRNRGLFASDQALLASAPTAAQVRQSAYGGYPWKLKFAAAMVKMGQIQVLTGGGGQIRAKCSAVN
ncbi:peroxidase 5 [Setaria viridis]|uniref:Peroxidase n=1 Tax=Setaria viridis TaxID=4556 RepID=A0A4V6D2G0_SETVI|nr:peroxidase 5-like [Setaria viridis]TKV98535.1 hypothetical protein SEVIR_9G566100v2 [Setaria viridis]